MTTAAIVPAYRPDAGLGECVAALATQVDLVIVVAGGANAALHQAAAAASGRMGPGAALEVVYLDANPGYAGAVNVGAKRALAAGAAYIFLTNDDCVALPGSIAALQAPLEADPGTAATTAKTVYPDRPQVLNGTGGRWWPERALAALRGEGEPDDGRYANAPDPDYPSGAASLVARTAWEQVGPLDEAWFLYYEDVDFGLAARRAGWRLRYVPEARVLHRGSASTADDPAIRRYYNVRNRLRCAARHAPPIGRAWAWCATLLLLAKQPLRYLFARRRREAVAVATAVADHLAGRYGKSPRFG